MFQGAYELWLHSGNGMDAEHPNKRQTEQAWNIGTDNEQALFIGRSHPRLCCKLQSKYVKYFRSN